ncbi:WYL domain-containing protein [Paenibacillus sp. JX-17]|uniref:WYL domain-containing protein n=1 Tax=Paenibacillus lacisoli TaxID=3064525 RepID=A0ABT9CEH3_9BACL|nr:WYL domain-containing protein [Paenibacillus sp. JX-17]MDO7907621.1 WYL domain-containing protein [Paenibacillus sp. JX-17]
MAKESFDKEIQFLRMLVLTSGAYNRQQFADRLGISVNTFDKTLRRLKDIVQHTQQQLPEDQGQELADAIRYRYHDTSDPMLLFLFRAKSLKESESHRLALLIAALHEQTQTAMELLDCCVSGFPADLALPDEKTIRKDLKYLEEVGIIRKVSASRPYRYGICHELVTELSDDELQEVYDFVDIMANTQVPSIQGYLLRDGLKKHLTRRESEAAAVLPFWYKYHYYSRILDEAHLFTLLEAIRSHRRIQFLYFSPKTDQNYGSRNTNPLFERDSIGKQVTTLPLKLVYDHQYGRWYLLSSERDGIRKYRMEGMTEISLSEPVDAAVYHAKRQVLEEKTRYSWLIDTGRPVTVRARFYNPGTPGGNFVRERVLMQGQWGEITEETDESFIYEITVNGWTEIRPWLRSFGSSCEVLEPRQLRQEFIAEWKEIQSYYESVRENI